MYLKDKIQHVDSEQIANWFFFLDNIEDALVKCLLHRLEI